MSDYRVGVGSNVVLGSLTVLAPQPRSIGLQYTRVTYSANGVAYFEAPYVELLWSAVASASEYVTILTAFGLNSSASTLVTVYIRNEQFSYVRMNGRATRPAIGRGAAWDNYFVRDVTITVRNLEASS